MLNALIAAAVIAFLGLLGAGAFNPGDGFLLRSEPLWRVSGIASYLGFAAIPLIALTALGRTALALAARIGQRFGNA